MFPTEHVGTPAVRRPSRVSLPRNPHFGHGFRVQSLLDLCVYVGGVQHLELPPWASPGLARGIRHAIVRRNSRVSSSVE